MSQTAEVIDLRQRAAQSTTRTRATIKALKGYRGLTDDEIGQRIGWTRQKVQSYIAGPTKITTEAITVFAHALRVPDSVIVMEKDDALRWVLDHAPTPGPEGPDDECAPRDSNSEPADCPIVPLRRGFVPAAEAA